MGQLLTDMDCHTLRIKVVIQAVLWTAALAKLLVSEATSPTSLSRAGPGRRCANVLRLRVEKATIRKVVEIIFSEPLRS